MFTERGILTLAVACLTGAATAGAAVVLPANSNKAWLGVMLGNAGQDGIEILDVVGKDSPAAVAGILKGDVITRFNGAVVSDLGGFVGAVQSAKPGQQVIVDLRRDGAELSLSVTLGTRPADADSLAPKPFGFRFQNKGPGFFIHQAGPGWSGELHRILQEMDLNAGSVKINVECEGGKGTLTVDQDGKVETREFDCSEMEDSTRLFQWQGADFEVDDFEINIPELPDIDLPEMKRDLKDKLFFHGGGPGQFFMKSSPSTRFNVDADGRIAVTVRKGESELNLTFKDEDDLESSRPDLYEKYEDLMSEVDE